MIIINHIHPQKHNKDYSIILFNMVLDFLQNLILTQLSENKVLIFFYYFASLLNLIKGAFIQVNNMVCHTYDCQKKKKNK